MELIILSRKREILIDIIRLKNNYFMNIKQCFEEIYYTVQNIYYIYNNTIYYIYNISYISPLPSNNFYMTNKHIAASVNKKSSNDMLGIFYMKNSINVVHVYFSPDSLNHDTHVHC